MPFPYVSAQEIQRELPYGHEGSVMTESEWNTFLTDKAKQESQRMETWLDDDYRGENADVPLVIRAAVIRLVRSIVTQIDSDGLNSEDVGDHSEDYRPPKEVREEVRSELGESGYTEDDVFQLDAMGK